MKSTQPTPDIYARRANNDIQRFGKALSRLLTKVHGSEERAEDTIERFRSTFTWPNVLAAGGAALALYVAFRALRSTRAPALLDE